MKEIIFESFDKKNLNCSLWDDVDNPKGVIQMVHGMTSYANRYDDFAKTLNNNGYIAFADDHRGHGKTAGEHLGVVGVDNFNNCVQDQIEITKMLKDEYKLPVQIFAHSYGSFLIQRYIQINSDIIDGVIMSGSAYMGGNILYFGKLITAVQKLLFGTKKPDSFLYNMTYKSKNKPFLQDGLNNAWLNRDLEIVKQYNADPLCGYIVSIGFYYAMMRGLIDCYKPKNLEKIRKDLPIKILSGEKDPLGGMGEKVKKLYEMYKSLDMRNVSMKLYPGTRHELTGDFDKDIIIHDMIKFYDENIK